jgi:hypothetical protein
MNKNVLSSISFVTVFVLILMVMPATHDGVSEAEAYMTTDPLSPLRIQTRPTFPKPGENVQLSLQAGSMNLSSALITWRVNGTVVMQGHGASSYTLQTSLVGSTYTIEVTAQSPSGATLSGFINISVSDIAVVWEGSTYTPTLYKGRPMYSAGSLARVMAMPTVLDPNGRVYSPDDLTYRWYVGGSRVAAHEGKGRYSVDLASDRPMQSIAALVHVFDPAGNERIRQSFNIPVRSPNLLYYVNDSTFGLLLERSLEGSYSMQQKEEVITAEPYHMNVRSRNDQGLRYEWKVGGNEVQAMGSILLSSEGTSVGSSRVTTRVVSSSQFLQSAQNELLVRFNDIDVSGPITTPL